jgi:predicted GNAT family acetyltransferase
MDNLVIQIKNDGIVTFTIKALKLILRKTIGFIWGTEIIYEYLLKMPIEEIEPKIKVTIRAAVEDDLDKFKGIVNERKIKLFRKRFKKDRICFIALDQEKIAYFGWISFDDEYESIFQIRVKVNHKEAYWFDCHTTPQYRHNGLHSAITAKALIYLKDRGCKKVFTHVMKDNSYSRKAFKKVGFKEKRMVTLIKLFNFKHYIYRDFKGKL